MKVWILTPIKLKMNSHDWPGDTNKGWVRIRADSEQRAREIARIAFEATNVNKTIHSPAWASLPWNDPEYVKCTFESEDLSEEEGILGID